MERQAFKKAASNEDGLLLYSTRGSTIMVLQTQHTNSQRPTAQQHSTNCEDRNSTGVPAAQQHSTDNEHPNSTSAPTG